MPRKISSKTLAKNYEKYNGKDICLEATLIPNSVRELDRKHGEDYLNTLYGCLELEDDLYVSFEVFPNFENGGPEGWTSLHLLRMSEGKLVKVIGKFDRGFRIFVDKEHPKHGVWVPWKYLGQERK